MNNIFSQTEHNNTFLILLAIFFVVLCSIFLIRLTFTILIHFAKKKYAGLKEKTSLIFHKTQKKFDKVDEELLRKLEIPRAHSETRASKIGKEVNESYELIPSEEQQLAKEEMNEVNIVDIVKPIGFWTSVILGQKLTYLIQSAQIINKRGRKGFWVSMIEAQEQAAGRQHGRSR